MTARIEHGWLIDDEWPGGPMDTVTPGAPTDPGFTATDMLTGCILRWRPSWRPDAPHLGAIEFVHPASTYNERPVSGPVDSVESREHLQRIIWGAI